MKKTIIEFHSNGPDGNIYAILGKVRNEMRKQQRIADYNNTWEQVNKTNSYREAIAVLRQLVDLKDLDGCY